jgi:membrane-associated phospholipid phosphatase
MTKYLVLYLLLFLPVQWGRAQSVDTTRSDEGPVQKMYTAALNSIEWYDIPIALVDVAQLALAPANPSRKLISYPPSAFDEEVQSRIGASGSSFLSNRIGEAEGIALFSTRFLYTLGSDLMGNDITSLDYQRTFIFYKSLVYTYSLTMLAKNLVYRGRPDKSDSKSFFSGHSSTAFCTASYLSLELGDWFERWESTRSNPMLKRGLQIGSTVGLYGVAAYVAYARLKENKHYFSDVAVGAVVGTVVGALVYKTYAPQLNPRTADVSFSNAWDNPTLTVWIRF